MINSSNIIVDNKKLSNIAFGTHKIKMSNLEHSMHLLDLYCDKGGNVIDTARSYQSGETENCIGEWIKQRGNREKLVLITKGCNSDFSKENTLQRLNPYELEKDITESLKALKTENIDIYFFHKDDTSVDPCEAIEMLNKYVKQGIIKHIGASNWTTKRIDEANKYAQKHGLQQFEYSELAFSLKVNSTTGWGEKEQALEMNREDYEWYKKSKMPVFGYNSQAYGFFYKDNINNNETQLNLQIYECFKEICNKNRMNVYQVLFGFYFGCEIENIPIIATSTIEHLQEIIQNCDTVLDKKSVQDLLVKRWS